MIDARQAVLDAAYQAHPERFIAGPPKADRPPAAAWINKPTIQTKSQNNRQQPLDSFRFASRGSI